MIYSHNYSVGINRVIQDNRLDQTDLRYSVALSPCVADVLQADDEYERTNNDIYRRLLVVDTALTGTDYRAVWGVASAVTSQYIVPKKVTELSSESVEVYQIPSSSRLLTNELLEVGFPKNLMGNERIAASLGRLAGHVHAALGMAVDFSDRVAIVDFLSENIEPVLIVPPITLIEGGIEAYSTLADRFSDAGHLVSEIFKHSYEFAQNGN